MEMQKSNNIRFKSYPYALYATDVKFQSANRSVWKLLEQKHYFSGKHKPYGFKVEASVAYPGAAVDVLDQVPGSGSGLRIFTERAHVHMGVLGKSSTDTELDHGKGRENFLCFGQYLLIRGIKG